MTRAAGFAMRAAELRGLLAAGDAGDELPLAAGRCGSSFLAEGFPEVAASTAETTVLAACRAPTPKTLPNRTASIFKV